MLVCLRFSGLLFMALLFGNQTVVQAQENHENHGMQAGQHEQHHAHHEHHKAVAEVEGYVSKLTRYSIPQVQLVESDGKEVNLLEAIDSQTPVMLNFIFTTCTAICPTMSATFAQVAKKMDGAGEMMQLVSISVDPEQDTPAALVKYAKKFAGGSHWRLFTGTTGNSILTQRAFDAYRGDKMNHIPLTFIRGSNSGKWLRIEGLASADELIKEYKALVSK